MIPFILKVAAVGVAALWGYKKLKAPRDIKPSPLPGVVSTLTKGRLYAVTAVVTKDITADPLWSDVELSNMTDKERFAAVITRRFTDAGCQLTTVPQIMNDAEAQKSLAGEPSAWIFAMRWTLDADHVETPIPWLGNAQFVLLPST